MNQRDQDGQRRLNDAVRGAFERAPELEPRQGFTDELRERLRQESARTEGRGRRTVLGRWVPLAALVTLTAGVAAAFFLTRALTPAEALARDAMGDHTNCALKARTGTPMPLEEAAQRFDGAYRLLATSPPDETSTPDGVARVVDRHVCAFGDRRFGHVVMDYHGHVVSLLMAEDEGAAGLTDTAGATPHLIGRPANGLRVVSVSGVRHEILLVGDLDGAELTRLSRVVAMPLAGRLNGGRNPVSRGLLALLALEPLR
jgi:hypothetical protein